MTDIPARERVERAHAKGYYVDEDGIPRNPNGDKLTGSTSNVWGITVWLDGRGRHVDVLQLSACTHWDDERWEKGIEDVMTHDNLSFVPLNGDKLDARPENIAVAKPERGGKLTWEDEDDLVEDFKGGMSRSAVARKYGVDPSTVLSILKKRDDVEV